MSSLYERLGLERNADPQDIRRAYLRLSKTEHPDKGGSEERFKQIQQAYEVLSDDEKRSFYDQTGQIPGEDGAPGGGGGPSGGGMPFPFPFDLGGMFGGMFGGGGPFGGGSRGAGPRMRRPKAPPKIHEIGLTLHDYFYGKRIQLKFERQKFCDVCKGEGATEFEDCGLCNGSGVRRQAVMIGPGMQAISQGPCGPCGGNGKSAKTPCHGCKGLKFSTQEKILQITIEPGMRPGEMLQFPNECSDHPDFEQPGDVHIIMREAEESVDLLRTVDDLSTTCSITLSQALLGTQMTFHGHPAHPTGLVYTIPPGTMRGDTIVVNGEGMPRRGTTQRGNFLVTVKVEVTAQEREALVRHSGDLKVIFQA